LLAETFASVSSAEESRAVGFSSVMRLMRRPEGNPGYGCGRAAETMRVALIYNDFVKPTKVFARPPSERESAGKTC